MELIHAPILNVPTDISSNVVAETISNQLAQVGCNPGIVETMANGDLIAVEHSINTGDAVGRMLRAPPNRGSPDAEPGVAQQGVRRMRNQELPNKGSSNGVALPDAEQGVKGFTS
jgi:hypothetical protein